MSQPVIATPTRIAQRWLSRRPTGVKNLKWQASEWLLQERLSPKLISDRWSVQGMDGVNHETIYQWIWRGKARRDLDIADLYKHLKYGRRRRKRDNDNDSRGILTDRVGIEQRPEVIGKRTVLATWKSTS